MDKPNTIGDVISSPEKWTKWASARNASNQRCTPCDDTAVCWCLSGAKTKLALNQSESCNLKDLMDSEAQNRGYADYISFNDHPNTTFADIQDFLAAVGQSATR